MHSSQGEGKVRLSLDPTPLCERARGCDALPRGKKSVNIGN